MSKTDDERRIFPRIPLLSEVWIKEPTGMRHARSQDLSKGGICIFLEGEDRPHKGALMDLVLRLPNDTQTVELCGEVAWASPGQIGVRFVDVGTTHALRIEEAIERALAELQSFETEKTPSRETSR